MAYDFMLMFQHFVLYKDKRRKVKSSSILLGGKDPNQYAALIDDVEAQASFDTKTTKLPAA